MVKFKTKFTYCPRCWGRTKCLSEAEWTGGEFPPQNVGGSAILLGGEPFDSCKFGPGENRTRDLYNAIVAFSQLNYRPTNFKEQNKNNPG